MVINLSEKKAQIPVSIGYWKGTLTHINPNREALNEIYGVGESTEEPKYEGTDKNGKDWSLLRFIFQNELDKTPVDYKIFMSKEPASFEKDGVTKTWYVNQFGDTQCTDSEKNLFRSFTHWQTYNKDAKVFEDVLIDGNAVELIWRVAYKGESALYTMLKQLVTQDWFKANPEQTNMFISVPNPRRNEPDQLQNIPIADVNLSQLTDATVKDIQAYIGTDYFQSLIGMCQIEAKDEDGGINYYQNCVDGAWMRGFRLAETNLITSSKTWEQFEKKENSKGKKRDYYQFYQAVKRCKNMTEFVYLHAFDPNAHQAAGTETFKQAPETTQEPADTSY
eukprot:GHVU01214564.1.p1 GENE.GHVU01214564.1~~GHVU01214564.1.p1  ORF type:complete len:335 (+),score=44.61 GHVU01214564.1:870-1874(+)